MVTRKSKRPHRPASPRRLSRGPKRRCVVCEELFDSPTLSIKVKKGRAHILCATLDSIGLKKLARSSGHW